MDKLINKIRRFLTVSRGYVFLIFLASFLILALFSTIIWIYSLINFPEEQARIVITVIIAWSIFAVLLFLMKMVPWLRIISFDKIRTIIRDVFLLVTASALILSATAFYISYLYKAAFVRVTASISTSSTSTIGVLSSINGELPIETVGVILAVVLAFEAAVVILAYNVLKRDIKVLAEKRIKDSVEAERKAFGGEAHVGLSYMVYELYQFTEDVMLSCQECLKKGAGELCILHEKMKKNDYLTQALAYAEKAFKKVQGINRELYGNVIMSVKNNLGFFIALQQDKTGKIDSTKKALALNIKDDLWNFVTSDAVYSYNDISETDLNEYKETCARIMFYLGNEDQKKEARQIVLGMEEYFGERFPKIKTIYGITEEIEPILPQDRSKQK